jgi:hypothetical protein
LANFVIDSSLRFAQPDIMTPDIMTQALRCLFRPSVNREM